VYLITSYYDHPVCGSVLSVVRWYNILWAGVGYFFYILRNFLTSKRHQIDVKILPKKTNMIYTAIVRYDRILYVGIKRVCNIIFGQRWNIIERRGSCIFFYYWWIILFINLSNFFIKIFAHFCSHILICIFLFYEVLYHPNNYNRIRLTRSALLPVVISVFRRLYCELM